MKKVEISDTHLVALPALPKSLEFTGSTSKLSLAILYQDRPRRVLRPYSNDNSPGSAVKFGLSVADR